MKLLAGTSNIPLVEEIATHLNIPLTQASIRRFPDNEIFVEILEEIRGEDTFVIQSTNSPVNDYLMELLVTLDALKRSSAGRIIACLPYFGYARQDRKSGPRTPITAKLVADILITAGADHVMTVDLHTEHIEGFFDLPVNNLSVSSLFYRDIEENLDLENFLVVSPDIGGVGRARALAHHLQCPMVIMDKWRNKTGVSCSMNGGGDVRGYHCLIRDDIVDSAGTLCGAAEALLHAGATSVRAYVTHGVFSSLALERLENSALEEVVITDSILATNKVKKCSKIRQISLAPLLGEAIARIRGEQSVSSLYG